MASFQSSCQNTHRWNTFASRTCVAFGEISSSHCGQVRESTVSKNNLLILAWTTLHRGLALRRKTKVLIWNFTSLKGHLKWGVFLYFMGVYIFISNNFSRAFTHSNWIVKLKPENSHHPLVSLSIHPLVKEEESSKKKTNLSRILHEFLGLIFVEVLVLKSWFSFPKGSSLSLFLKYPILGVFIF